MKKLFVVAAAIMILVCGSLWLKDREAQQRAQAQEDAAYAKSMDVKPLCTTCEKPQ